MIRMRSNERGLRQVGAPSTLPRPRRNVRAAPLADRVGTATLTMAPHAKCLVRSRLRISGLRDIERLICGAPDWHPGDAAVARSGRMFWGTIGSRLRAPSVDLFRPPKGPAEGRGYAFPV